VQRDIFELNEELTNEELKDGQAGEPFEELPEAEPLWYMTQSQDHRPLLAHPVITSFLCLKWRRIRAYYYTNLALYLLFLSMLTSYLVLSAINKKTTDNGLNLSWLQFLTLALSIALMVRETFQALVSPRRYFFNVENLLELIMLAFSIYLTKSPFDNNQQHQRNLAAAAILLSWMEMFLLLGRHPKLSTFITMFFTVSLKFLVFLTWYISIIVAFGIAFFFILHKEDANDYFKNPEKSLIKTIM